MSYQCRMCRNENEMLSSYPSHGATRSTYSKVYSFVRCFHCGSFNAIGEVNYNEIYKDYPLKNQRYDFFATKIFEKRLSYLIEFGLTKQHLVLDYGCGSGLFVRYMNERGFKAYGFDLYNPLFSSRSFPNQKFDFVIAQDVFEHFDDPQSFIEDAKSLIQYSGKIILGFPFADNANPESPIDLVGVMHQPFHRFIPSHKGLLSFFSQSDLSINKTIEKNYMDTLIPFVNTAFLYRYLLTDKGCLDIGFEPIRILHFLKNPLLIFWGFFGYFFQSKNFLIVSLSLKK